MWEKRGRTSTSNTRQKYDLATILLSNIKERKKKQFFSEIFLSSQILIVQTNVSFRALLLFIYFTEIFTRLSHVINRSQLTIKSFEIYSSSCFQITREHRHRFIEEQYREIRSFRHRGKRLITSRTSNVVSLFFRRVKPCDPRWYRAEVDLLIADLSFFLSFSCSFPWKGGSGTKGSCIVTSDPYWAINAFSSITIKRHPLLSSPRGL